MLVFLAGLVCLLLGLAYFRVTLQFWSVSLFSYLLVSMLLLPVLTTGFFIIVIAILGILFVLNLRILRKRLISKPVLRLFKKVLPPLSNTEREAMEAGEVWWDAELFTGKPNWDLLLSTPKPQLSDEEQAFLDGPVQTLCERLDDWQISHRDKDLSPENLGIPEARKILLA